MRWGKATIKFSRTRDSTWLEKTSLGRKLIEKDEVDFRYFCDLSRACIRDGIRLIEGAKEDIIDGVGEEKARSLNTFWSSLNSARWHNERERAKGEKNSTLRDYIAGIKCYFDDESEYYLTERRANLPFVTERTRKIVPVFMARKAPMVIKSFYREAVMSYLDGRFSSCCVMCRTIVEMFLKDFLGKRAKIEGLFDNEMLEGLITKCGKSKLMDLSEIRLIEKIQKKGNKGIHSSGLMSEEDALTSIQLVQEFLQKQDSRSAKHLKKSK